MTRAEHQDIPRPLEERPCEDGQRFRILFETMSEGVILFQMLYDESGLPVDYCLTDVNPAAERILGISRDAAVGGTVTSVLGLSEPPFLDVYARVAETGEPVLFSTHFAPLGRCFRVSAFSPARGQFATVFEDISRQIEAEREKARLEEQLRQSQKMEAVGQLAGGMAHDFNNLLTVVLGHLELAQSQLAADHPVQGSLTSIERAARQATGLTRSLLTFSRKYHADKRPTDLGLVVMEAGKVISRSLPASIKVAIDAVAPSGIWVNGDAAQLQQALVNLAVNAAEAMPDGGALKIALSRVDGPAGAEQEREVSLWPTAQITVSDTGAGMGPELLSRIFEPFFTTKSLGEGTGLGLAIVHGIIRDHKGKITTESKPGRGTTFTIRLPGLAPAGQTLAAEVTGTPGESSAACGTVLLAEDNEAIRRLIRRSLEASDLKVVEAADGVALMEMRAHLGGGLNLLIVDIDLPHISGLNCLEQFRRAGDLIPAIVITGSAAVEMVEKPLPCTRLLRKPFRVPELLSTIQQMIATPAHQA